MVTCFGLHLTILASWQNEYTSCSVKWGCWDVRLLYDYERRAGQRAYGETGHSPDRNWLSSSRWHLPI